MISELDGYYISKEEPTRGCLIALREFILSFNENITETWTHRMPMFRYKGKLFCYLWIDKKTYKPYLGIYKGLEVDHPLLELGNRKKMKTFHIEPDQDLPIETMTEIFDMAIPLYEK